MKAQTITLGLLTAAMLTTIASANDGDRASEFARDHILVDTHIDVPYRLNEKWSDVTGSTEKGDFDYPRAVAGGLDVPFMSIYTPPSLEEKGKSWQVANQLIDSVEALVARAPERFAIVATPSEAVSARSSGKIAMALGMENGSPIAGELENLKHFRERGVSYITLTHSEPNHISDSSFADERPHGGLSVFGKELVKAMNHHGVMVDISHVSDDAFWQVIELSEVPVIASHSSARHFTPGFERNMSDEMIVALAGNGGVIMINFGSSFITAEAQQWYDNMKAARSDWQDEHGFDSESPEYADFSDDYRERIPFPFADLKDVVDHYLHIIKLVGVDHVGIGSDYDGVGDSLPNGLKDVSTFPNLVRELSKAGVSDEDIAKILGGNIMRVWAQVLEFSDHEMSSTR